MTLAKRGHVTIVSSRFLGELMTIDEGILLLERLASIGHSKTDEFTALVHFLADRASNLSTEAEMTLLRALQLDAVGAFYFAGLATMLGKDEIRIQRHIARAKKQAKLLSNGVSQ